MKLQLALDVLSLEDALALTRAAEEWVERVELGTPFLLEYGMEAVRRFRAAFPYKELLADTKIMDAGRLEAESAFQAGADLDAIASFQVLPLLEKTKKGHKMAADISYP